MSAADDTEKYRPFWDAFSKFVATEYAGDFSKVSDAEAAKFDYCRTPDGHWMFMPRAAQ